VPHANEGINDISRARDERYDYGYWGWRSLNDLVVYAIVHRTSHSSTRRHDMDAALHSFSIEFTRGWFSLDENA
jgi:hypothetical protein